MSWLYFQTWIWFLIAFTVGVLVAWALLVLPQQRRLRTLLALASTPVDHDLRTESGSAAATAVEPAVLVNDGRGADPTTDQFPAVAGEPSALRTTELPVQQPAADPATSEIPVVGADQRAWAGDSTETGPLTLVDAAAAEPADESPTAEPATAQPAPTEDSTTGESTIDAPITDESTIDAPTTDESTTTDSTTDESTSTESTPAEPATDKPTATKSAASESAVAESPAAEPTTGEPTTAEAGDPAEPPAAFTAGAYPGSALPLPDGSAPGPEFTIKGNEDSMLFHAPESPYHGRTKAEVWFRTPQDAEAAGFTSWSRSK